MTDNELIAEFLDFHVDGPGYENRYVHFKDSNPVLVSKLQYHTSWDWLMPACKKWDHLYENNPVLAGNKYYSLLSGRLDDAVIRNYDIKDAFEQLVRNIKWYNIRIRRYEQNNEISRLA